MEHHHKIVLGSEYLGWRCNSSPEYEIHLLLAVISLPDQGSIRARFAGRSYWRLRYTDGRVVSEWEVDWSLAPKLNRQSLRLYCPDGQIAELGEAGRNEITGRCFQFKDAIISAGGLNGTLSQIVGLVENTNGDCRWAAWFFSERRLATGHSNVHDFQYDGVPIGTLAFDHLGMKG